MASGWTNKGKMRMLEAYFRAVSVPTNLYLALVTSANVPDADTNLMSDLTEIAAGNGYTSGGTQLTPGTTDFDSITENDSDDRGEVQIKDIDITASGGTIPPSGSGARYAVLTDDDGTIANREVYFFFDLVSDRTITNGNTLSLKNLEMRIT